MGFLLLLFISNWKEASYPLSTLTMYHVCTALEDGTPPLWTLQDGQEPSQTQQISGVCSWFPLSPTQDSSWSLPCLFLSSVDPPFFLGGGGSLARDCPSNSYLLGLVPDVLTAFPFGGGAFLF